KHNHPAVPERQITGRKDQRGIGAPLLQRQFDRWEWRRGRAETYSDAARIQHTIRIARKLYTHKPRIVYYQAVPLIRKQHLGQAQAAGMHAVERKVGSVNT